MNRQYLHIKHIVIAGLALVITICGCSDDLGIDIDNDNGDVLKFVASMNDKRINASTRSDYSHVISEEEIWLVDEGQALKTRVELTKQLEGDISVNAYANDNSIKIDGLVDTKYTFDSDIMVTQSPVKWSSLTSYSNILFSAFTPYVDLANLDANSPYSLPGENDANYNKPVFYYSVEDTANQIDMIADVALIESNDFNKDVELSFNHVLTAIRFKVGFDCNIKKLTISNVFTDGEFNILTSTMTTKSNSEKNSFVLDFTNDGTTGTDFNAGDIIESDENNEYLIMIPQTLPTDAVITLEYDDSQTITSNIGSKNTVWESGKMITYTFHKTKPNYIYLDLALDSVFIGKNGTYSGSVYRNGVVEKVSGKHDANNKYYVYQTTESNRATCGLQADNSFVRPPYPSVKRNGGQEWSQYIINNTDVDAVIENWVTDVAAANRKGTKNRISVFPVANTSFDLIIDNIYSTYQKQSQQRTTGGISFEPVNTSNCKLTIFTKGDNRLGNIHYYNKTSNGSSIIFEGEGSLTVADVDLTLLGQASGLTGADAKKGYFGNYYCSAIGGNDDGTREICYGIEINSGILFAGSTVAENCSAIGGGGNGLGEVTINGGTVTAVASTTGTAIGGGIGFSSMGGKGIVTINGGNVYAYNLDNKRGIPSSAIGGAGSSASVGTEGIVTINGGNVYAYSALGTAIGGGSSKTQKGGDAYVYINGGMTIAESGSGAGIGGGSACTGGSNTSGYIYNGGTATIEITNLKGTPIIRTGSIGGGDSKDPKGGKIGSADINISGGDIQAQFVMASGAKTTPKFTMSGGLIRNSDVHDPVYKHIKTMGGAVYMDFGEFIMTGGDIKSCNSEKGGAVYITDPNASDDEVPTFTMTGGTISDCTSETDGGALYLAGGNVTVGGNAQILKNMARAGNGGGICLEKGEFKMEDNSKIQSNTALFDNDGSVATGGNGGGVYVSSTNTDLKVDILNGEVSYNSSNRRGGGIYVNMENSSAIATIKVGGTDEGLNPQITNNHTLYEGGGLYAIGENANITIYNGSITENSVSGYVENPDVANIGGLVTLEGGDVKHIVVTFDGNKGYTDDAEANETATQKIVTNTRSKLIAPAFARTGWDFVGWNERADGTGKSYANNDEINRNTDLTLYAQWKLKGS